MKFNHIKTKDIKPSGWLAEYLERQISGLTGNIEKAGSPFNTEESVWASKTNATEWYPYEQQGYWIDGAVRVAHEMKNEALYSKIKDIIYKSIELAENDGGYIGPDCLKPEKVENFKKEKYIRWPHSVYFRALMAEYENTGDEKILEALCNHYKNDDFFYRGRNVCSVECLAWLYKKTGDEFFKTRAVETFENYLLPESNPELTVELMTGDEEFYIHGVTLCEKLKLMPILYDITGDKKYLDWGVRAMDKLIDQALMVDGVISSEEFTRTNTAIMAHETCDIADFSWALGYFFEATGDTKYLDIIERACLNAAPAVVTPDFTALQYFASPNQLIASENSTHCRYTRGMWTMSYRPYGYAACCTGNVNRIMPNYIAKMWYEKDDELYATLYGASEFTSGDFKITQVTDFPFARTLKFIISCPKPTYKKIGFRIPGWAEGALFNAGDCSKFTDENGFCCVTKKWKDGDEISVEFGAHPALKESAEGGAYIEYGPLLFAFNIPKQDKTFIAQDAEYLSHEMIPTGDWNWALRCDLIRENGLTVKKVNEDSYVWEKPRLVIEVPVEKINGFDLIRTNKIERYVYSPENSIINSEFVFQDVMGDFVMTPEIPDSETAEQNRSGKVENITLVPYGVAKLRLTVFPKLTK